MELTLEDGGLHMKIHKETKDYITEVFYKYSIGLTLKESINGNY